MLPLKPFSFCEPKDLAELHNLVATMDEKTKFMAGGTDLLPNLKHGLYDINRIVSLRRIEELRNLTVENNRIVIGALIRLHEIVDNENLQRLVPSLTKAAGHIASPQIRNMGTVGGNICLDTRCLYFNQTEFWRSALGFCLKKDGCACHVVKTGKRCVAAASNDLATVLLAFNARITILSPRGEHSLLLDDFYSANGEKNNLLAMDEVVTRVQIDLPPRLFGGFYKVRMRDSIDFPMLSVAVTFHCDDGRMKNCKLVMNALVAKPKVMDLAEFDGLPYNRDLIAKIAETAYKKCHPQTNIGGEVAFRKHMILVATERVFLDALPSLD